MNIKTLAAVTVALTGALGAGLAQAHTDVQWSVTIGAPIFARPAPVYVQPAPVYAPAPVYYNQPVYGRPVPVHRYYQPTRWDRDGDGIPNRYDRWDNRGHGYDRDHDGIPNRDDRHPDRPSRR